MNAEEVFSVLERIKQLREKAGLSQKALAERIGVSQQSINKYENHNIEPDIETLILIADTFDTSVDYLIGHSALDHRIEALRACDLNEDEYTLLERYRALSKRRRQGVQALLEAFSDGDADTRDRN